MRVDDFKQKMALAGLAIDAAFVVIAAASIKMAADFQTGLVRLRTGAGDTQDSMSSLGKSIQQVAMDTGVMTGPLTDAMYQILSSGQRGKQAYDTLAAAAKGAQIEQANVVDVTKAVTTAMTDFSDKTINANQYMNGYIKAVSAGKITLQELSSALGPILPTANAFGVSFRDMAAAMSVQTNAGISAARAATSLRFMLSSLENPTAKANKEMKALGLSSVDVANEMKKSLPDALQMIINAAKKAGPEGSVPFNRAIADMVGGTRGLSAFLALTGVHMKDFVKDTNLIGTAMKNGKSGVDGWALAQNNLNIQTQKVMASVQVLGQTIGSALLPIVTPLIAKIGEIIQNFTKWLQVGNNMKIFLIAMAVVFAVVTIATIALTVAILAASVAAIVAQAAFWPVTLVILAIVAVIAIAIVIFLNWGRITAWVGQQFSRLSGWVQGVIATIRSSVVGNWNSMVSVVQGGTSRLVGWVVSGFNSLRDRVGGAISGLWGVVSGAFSRMVSGAFSWGANLIGGFIGGIFSMIGGVANAASQVAQAAANHLAHRSPPKMGPMSDSDKWAPNLMRMMTMGIIAGTPAFQNALANVGVGGIGSPKSSSIIPGGGGITGIGYGHTVKVVFELDKREMASIVGPAMADEIRLQLGKK